MLYFDSRLSIHTHNNAKNKCTGGGTANQILNWPAKFKLRLHLSTPPRLPMPAYWEDPGHIHGAKTPLRTPSPNPNQMPHGMSDNSPTAAPDVRRPSRPSPIHAEPLQPGTFQSNGQSQLGVWWNRAFFRILSNKLYNNLQMINVKPG